MKEKNISAWFGESEASGTRTPVSVISASHPHLQYPEQTLQLNSPKGPTTVPSPQSSAGSSPYLQFDENYNTGYSTDGAPKSIRSSRSSNRQHHSKSSPRHSNHRSSPPTVFSPESLRLSRQDSYAEPCHSSRHDPEKGDRTLHPVLNEPYESHAFSTYISEDEEVIKENAVWILVYLSFLSPIVATIISMFTLLTTICLLLLSPILYFCKPCRPLRERFYAFLTPPIHFQLSLVFSELGSDYGNIKPEHRGTDTAGRVVMLVVIHAFSPVYAAGIAVTAWIAAGFWATALILGNPDGRDGKDDGKAVVLGVRSLWESWLRKGLR